MLSFKFIVFKDVINLYVLESMSNSKGSIRNSELMGLQVSSDLQVFSLSSSVYTTGLYRGVRYQMKRAGIGRDW